MNLKNWLEVASVSGILTFASGKALAETLSQEEPNKQDKKVLIITQPELADSLYNEFNQYIADLEYEGYSPVLQEVSPETSPESLRTIIQNQYYSPDILDGVFLFGKYKAPFFQARFVGGDIREFPLGNIWWISDGDFLDTLENSGDTLLVPGSDGVYDTYTSSSILDIGCGMFFPDTSQNWITNARVYLIKIHEYKYGNLNLENKAMAFIDEGWTLNDTSDVRQSLELIFPSQDMDMIIDPSITSADEYRWRVKNSNYKLHYAQSHMSSTGILIYHEGQPEWIQLDEIEQMGIKPGFSIFCGCHAGRYTDPRGCVAMAYLLGHNRGLGSIASTTVMYGFDYEKVFEALAQEKTFCRALNNQISYFLETQSPNNAMRRGGSLVSFADPYLLLFHPPHGVEEDEHEGENWYVNNLEYKIKPNVIKRNFSVEVNNPGSLSLNDIYAWVYDVSGRLVGKYFIVGGIDASKFSSGTYFISLVSEKAGNELMSRIQKVIIIQH